MSTKRELFVYDGRVCMGRIVINGATDEADAFDADGKALGRFPGFKAAYRRILSATEPASEARKAAAAKARRRLTEPQPFASGLPARFLGR
jgi:hypothetical protein